MTTRVQTSQRALLPREPAGDADATIQRHPVDLVRVLLGLAVAMIFRNRLLTDDLDTALEAAEKEHTNPGMVRVATLETPIQRGN